MKGLYEYDTDMLQHALRSPVAVKNRGDDTMLA
jgi:hypothetical protein